MNDVNLSKALSWLLRHGALKEGLEISSDGYINVADILNHRNFRGKCSIADIERIVATSDKKRFTLRTANGILQICANQGHSLKSISNLDLTPITTKPSYEVIHGTYYKNWEKIKLEGLSRKNRNHIHFATGLPTDKNVISGMRKDVQVFIYIDVEKVLKDGLTLQQSQNGVVLCSGNEKGVLLPGYFSKVVDTHGKLLN